MKNEMLTVVLTSSVSTALGLIFADSLRIRNEKIVNKISNYYYFYLYLGIFFEKINYNLSNLESFKDRLNELLVSLKDDRSLLIYTNFPTLLDVKGVLNKVPAPKSSIYLSNEYMSLYSFITFHDNFLKSIKSEYKNIINRNYKESKSIDLNQKVEDIQKINKIIRYNTINGLEAIIKMISDFEDTIKENRLEQYVTVLIYLEEILKKGIYKPFDFNMEIWRLEGVSFKFFKNKRKIYEFKDYKNIKKRISSRYNDKVKSLIQ